jgi:hypothetical protein
MTVDSTLIVKDTVPKKERKGLYRLIRNAIVKPVRRASTGVFEDETRFTRQYEGKIIGEINIIRNNVFREDGKWLERAGNNIHALTYRSSIRRDLLFKSGDKLDPDLLVRNSQLLKSRPYLADATFYIKPNADNPDIVDIILVTRDSWTISGNLEFHRNNRVMVNIYDANFIGSGERLDISTNFAWRGSDGYGGNVISYSSPNFFGTFYTADATVGRDYENEFVSANLRKNFITPTDYTLGITFSGSDNQRHTVYSSDTVRYVHLKGLQASAWIGQSMYLRSLKSSIYLTGRYEYTKYYDRPFSTPWINPAFIGHHLFLVNAGIYREKFYTSTMIYGYGFKEYLPAGYNFELVGGYRWGEYNDDVYMGINASMGGFSNIGYLSGKVSLGSYLNPRNKHFSGSSLDVDVKWFSPLLVQGGSHIRQFININHTYMWNRGVGANELLTFTSDRGLKTFSEYHAGRSRTILNTETVVFTPFVPFGFHIALFGFADFGLIGNYLNIFRNDFFTTFGVGIRIKNERLIFNAIQIRLGVAFGKNGYVPNRIFSFSSEQRVSESRFLPTTAMPGL